MKAQKEKTIKKAVVKKHIHRKDGKTQNRVYKEKRDIIAVQSQLLSEESLRELPTEEIERRVKSYLDNCGVDWNGEIKGERLKSKPTLSGLALYLGISRLTLLNLESKDVNVFNTIKRAKQIIEHLREQRLWETGNQSGTIFVLKNNHGWKEETQHKNLNVNIDIDDLDPNIDFIFKKKE